jgi:IS5 family transposase
MSFTRSLGLRIGEAIPDYSTVWRFREALTQAGAVKPLFERFNAHLAAKGLLPQEGSLLTRASWKCPASATAGRRTP